MTPLPREIARALDGRPDAGALARTWQVLGSTLTDTLPHGAPTTGDEVSICTSRSMLHGSLNWFIHWASGLR